VILLYKPNYGHICVDKHSFGNHDNRVNRHRIKCHPCTFDTCPLLASDACDGNVSVILTLICNSSIYRYSDCRPAVTITPSAGPPYEASFQLTCAADGDNPIYEWSGTNGGNSFTANSITVTLEAGEFCLICTATVNSDPDCSTSEFRCGSASGKY